MAMLVMRVRNTAGREDAPIMVTQAAMEVGSR